MTDAPIDPAEHDDTAARMREQIITAAHNHFSHFGYSKTTVSDLAREIGFSKAYIYRFFQSKQEIGEAICRSCLVRVLDASDEAIAQGKGATDSYRRFFKTIVTSSLDLFFEDRRLYEIASLSAAEKWLSTIEYQESLLKRIESLILAGRASGEFERKTPLDETCRAISQVMQPFINPLLLQHDFENAMASSAEVASLVLRSLAP